ncbi:MAG: sulfate permease [Gammaproteobacteria bacterium]|nr:sulfate permease [Gammaproteobacteria bacterium]MCY4275333.1 sulfate permease [Gammaproteobacteria bacterium]
MKLHFRRLHTASRKLFPFLRWTGNLDRDTVRADFSAGLTGAAIVLPQGVAFAAIAGMPLEYGLYASIVPAIVAALFGSSWHLISGPTTAASVIMYSSLSVLALPGSQEYVTLAITLAFMVGITQFVMAMLRMGVLVNFISHSVIVGFMAGAALLIVAKQLKDFLGLEFPEQNNLYESVLYLMENWEAFHPMVLLISLITIGVALFFQKKWPQYPGMIAALVIGSLTAVLLNWVFGSDMTGIEMVGALPQRLPPISAPNLSIQVLQELAPLALAMTLFALTEAVSISRALALKSGQSVNSNQEFFGQGLSNIVGSFFSSYVATGSFNRSAANYEAGAKTPLSAIIAGVILIPLILLIAPLTAFLPVASVAALLILVALRLINIAQLKLVFTADRMEAAIVAVTFTSTILFKLEFAILLGVIMSLMIYLRKTSRPRIESRVPGNSQQNRKFRSGVSGPECPQLKILRIEDSIYFGSITYVREMLSLYREHYPEQKHLLILTKGINQIDWAGAELLFHETQERRKNGGDVYLYRLKRNANKVMKRGGYLDYIGKNNIFNSKHEAIAGIFEHLNTDICQNCTKRIFLECKKIPYPNEIEQKPSSRKRQPDGG